MLRNPEGMKARERENYRLRKGYRPTGPSTDRRAADIVDAIAAKFERGMSWGNTHKWHVEKIATLDQLGGDADAYHHPSNHRPVWNTQP